LTRQSSRSDGSSSTTSTDTPPVAIEVADSIGAKSRNPLRPSAVYPLKMANQGWRKAQKQELHKGVPAPTASFRRRAWLQFQRALDPLASPRPLRLGRR
jgi:hypothetical protein